MKLLLVYDFNENNPTNLYRLLVTFEQITQTPNVLAMGRQNTRNTTHKLRRRRDKVRIRKNIHRSY